MAMQALSNSKFDEARRSFGQAVKLDPNFGLAYAGMAIASSNMGQPQEAATYVQEAIRHVDKMTERERFRTRGMFYYITNDYEACVKEYGDLLARYEADAAARNNLALCSTKLRDMNRAREEMQRVVRDPAEALALPRQRCAVLGLRQRLRRGRGAGAGRPGAAGSVGAAGAGPRPAGPGQDRRGDQELRGAGQRARAPAAPTPCRAWPTSRSTRAGSPTPRRSSPMAPRPTWPRRTATAPRPSSRRSPTPSWRAAGGPQARAAADQAVANSTGVQIRFLAARIYAQVGRRAPRPGPSPRGWAPSCRPSRRPTARSSTV